MSSLLLIGIIDGRKGLRELLSKLLKWRVSVGWYAFAILPALILPVTILFMLSQPSMIFTTDDKIAVLFSSIVAGISIVLEEIGWTGFAVPRLRKRYSILITGLIVGIIWGAWHLLQGIWTSGTYAETLPLSFFLPLSILAGIAQLTAYRILLVWVYDRTKSLLVVTLMHASLSASTIFIFRPLSTGMSYLIYAWLFVASLWVVVVAIALYDKNSFKIK